MPSVAATCLGHPRIGARRELESALGSLWAGRTAPGDLGYVAAELRARHWSNMLRNMVGTARTVRERLAREPVSEEALARVPSALRGEVCVCERCAGVKDAAL